MNKYLTEFIGTYFLVLTIALSVLGGVSLPPLAIGCGLMVMVYMGGHISGAHYNPAITLAVALRGRCRWIDVVPYWMAQVLGSGLATVTAYWMLKKLLEVKPAAEYIVGNGLWIALLAEFLFTFALALVILNVATSKRTAGNSYYGLAIGFTVLTAAFVAGPISGGAFNPSVGFGPWLVGGLINNVWDCSYAWIYAAGPFAGAVVAALVFRLQNPEDFGA